MKTITELREERYKQSVAKIVEYYRLKEKVLCAEVTFPKTMQKDLGIGGLTMAYDELKEWIELEMENGDKASLTFTIKFSMKTNKWIETLPEANI